MKYKTKGNLDKVWNHIDNAMSEWYLALELLDQMKIEEDGDLKGLYETIKRVDISRIGGVKQHIEMLIEEKESK